MRAENRAARPVEFVFRPPAGRWTSLFLSTAAPREEVDGRQPPAHPLAAGVAD